MTEEDKRSAVSIHASISGILISASLVLAGVLLTFYDTKNVDLISFQGFVILFGVITAIASCVFAGMGFKDLRDKGFIGDWNFVLTEEKFVWQVRLNIIAMILFLFAFFTPANQSTEEKENIKTNLLLNKIYKLDSINSSKDDNLKLEIEYLKTKILKLEKDKKNCFPKKRKKQNPCQ